MKKISVDKDGLVSTAFYNDEQNKSIGVARTIDAKPILDHNKKLYTQDDGYSKSRELKRVASIPIIILEIWAKEYNGSSNWFKLPTEIQRKILKEKLNSSDYKYFRTAPGRF